MSFILPLLYFLLANLTLVILTKRSFGKCLPTTILLAAIPLFLSQFIFKTFKVGLLINYIFPLIGIYLLIFKTKDKKTFFKNYFSAGFISFIILYTFIYIYDLNRCIVGWDDISHWGVMVKEMLRLDRFYSVSESTLMVHKDYPPMIQLFEFFFCKLSGGYTDSTILKAIHLFNFSLVVVPIIDFIENNKIKTVIYTLFLIFLSLINMIIIGHPGLIGSIYKDYSMAIITSYIMFLIMFNHENYSNFNIFQIAVSLVILVLSKQMGLALACMCIFMYVLDVFFKLNKKEKTINLIKNMFNKKYLKYTLTVVISFVILPLCFFMLWSGYVDGLDCVKQFKFSDIKVKDTVNILRGRSGEEYQRVAVKNYIVKLYNDGISNGLSIRLTFIQEIALIILLIFLLWYFYNSKFKNKELTTIFITFILGTIGYTLTMLILYMFSFCEAESVAVASFERYMNTYSFIWTFLIIYIFSYFSIMSQKNIMVFVVSISLFILITPSNFYCFTPKLVKNGIMDEYIAHADKVMKNTKDGSRVMVIAQGDLSYPHLINYYSTHRYFNDGLYNLASSSEVDDIDEYFNKTVLPYMRGFDYLYLAKIDDDFIRDYSNLFDNLVENEQLYEIKYNNEEIKFLLVS